MKKNYHFVYTLDGLGHGDHELMEFDTFFPDESENFKDVKSYLDQQNFEVRNSVIKRLVEYAGRQYR